MGKKISASLMCADLLNLRAAMDELKHCGVDMLHCDVMDGHFVPNWMLFPDLINAIGQEADMPLDVHLMVDQPERLVPRLHLREGDIVSVNYESTPHIQRVLASIRDAGAQPALALNPGTPLVMAEDLLPDIDMLLIMTVNPGYAGQPAIPQAIEKIGRARNMLDSQGYSHIAIEVDGNCSFANIPRMVALGADVIVAGSSSLFHKDYSLKEAAAKLRKDMA